MMNLEKKHEGLYNNYNGYFMLNKLKGRYIFIPYEKEYNEEQLLDIVDSLRRLNISINTNEDIVETII